VVNDQSYFIFFVGKTLTQFFSNREPHILDCADLIFFAMSFLELSADRILVTNLEKNSLITR